MAIVLDKVSYIYMARTPFERQALHDVSLTIKDGSFTAIAGHTGSGKSTLLQHLNGLLSPTSGRVTVDDVDINDLSKSNRDTAIKMRQSVGMVFQYPEQQLFEETVAADIAFGPHNQGLSEQDIEARVREAMELVGLDYDKYSSHSPFELSGGQMRRVAIAGVLALHPRYLVLDEPTAGLDPRGREDLIAMIKRIKKQWKLTIVFVSHNMDDIARLADDMLVFKGGELLRQAAPRAVFADRELLAAAGLRPPQVQQIMWCLQESGMPVRTDVLDVDEAQADICRVLQGKGGR